MTRFPDLHELLTGVAERRRGVAAALAKISADNTEQATQAAWADHVAAVALKQENSHD
jgi:hypothetical protein